MTTKPIDLKPCPFCGGGVELKTDGRAERIYSIECFACDLKTRYVTYKKPLIRLWNTRLIDSKLDRIRALRREAVSALESFGHRSRVKGLVEVFDDVLAILEEDA